MLTELWLNCCKIQNVEAVSCPFTPPQSAMCQIALISDLIMAAGGNADVCAKTSFKLKFSRASLWSSWRSLSFRPLSRSTSYKRGNRKLEWKTLWSPSWTRLPSKMFEQLWNSALLSIFSPKPVLVVVMTTCFFEVGAGPWRLTLWKSFLLDPVARRDRDPNGRELPTRKYSNRRTILVVWFLFFLDEHQSMLLNRVSESHATRHPSTSRCVSRTHRPDLGNKFWKREIQAFQGFPIAEASQQPPSKCPSKWPGGPTTSY